MAGDMEQRGEVTNARFVAMDEDMATQPGASRSKEPGQAEAAAAAAASQTTENNKGQDQTPAASEKKAEKSAKDVVTVEDLNLPRSIITRLAKGALEPQTQIQGNAALAISKSATVFVSYLAAHANEHTQNAGKKTILPADVFKAIEDTEFSFMKDALEAEFAKHQQTISQKRSTYRQKKRAENTSTAAGDDDTHMGDVSSMSAPGANDTLTSAPGTTDEPAAAGQSKKGTAGSQARGKEPEAKRVKRDAAAAVAGGVAAAVGAGAAAAAIRGEEMDDAETEPEDEGEEDENEEEEGDDDEEEEDEDEDEEGDEEEGDEGEDGKNGEEAEDEALDGDDSD